MQYTHFSLLLSLSQGETAFWLIIDYVIEVMYYMGLYLELNHKKKNGLTLKLIMEDSDEIQKKAVFIKRHI